MEVVVSTGPRPRPLSSARGCHRMLQAIHDRACRDAPLSEALRSKHPARPIDRLDVNAVILTALNGRPHDASAAVPPDYVDRIVAQLLAQRPGMDQPNPTQGVQRHADSSGGPAGVEEGQWQGVERRRQGVDRRAFPRGGRRDTDWSQRRADTLVGDDPVIGGRALWEGRWTAPKIPRDPRQHRLMPLWIASPSCSVTVLSLGLSVGIAGLVLDRICGCTPCGGPAAAPKPARPRRNLTPTETRRRHDAISRCSEGPLVSRSSCGVRCVSYGVRFTTVVKTPRRPYFAGSIPRSTINCLSRASASG